MTIGGCRGLLEGLNNYFVSSFGPNFDDSVTKIYTCDRTLTGHLVESLAFGFMIHLWVSLTDEEGEAFMGALGVDRMDE